MPLSVREGKQRKQGTVSRTGEQGGNEEGSETTSDPVKRVNESSATGTAVVAASLCACS